MPNEPKRREACPVCGRSIQVKKDGTVRVHGGGWLKNCEGSGRFPVWPSAQKGEVSDG